MTDILDTRFENQKIDLDKNITKLGDDVNLLEKDPTLRKMKVAVGWNSKAFGGLEVDVDISIFLLNHEKQTPEDQDFIFYNNLEAHEGAVQHIGDNRTGAGDGDDEEMIFDLHGLPFNIQHIAFVYSIYRGREKEQTLGLIKNSYIRLINPETGQELVRFELDEHFQHRSETAALVGMVNREGPKWHFTPQIEYHAGGLEEIATQYGIVVIRQ